MVKNHGNRTNRKNILLQTNKPHREGAFAPSPAAQSRRCIAWFFDSLSVSTSVLAAFFGKKTLAVALRC